MKTTNDAFLNGALRIAQPADGHRSGHDAVLLAARVKAESKPTRICELGAGVGVASLCIAHRIPEACVIGIECVPELVALANQNATANGLETRARFVCADITTPVAQLPVKPASFNCIIANPPYYDTARIPPIANPDKARAWQSGDLTLAQMLDIWIKRACALATANAWVHIIHRPEALPDLLRAMTPRLGDIVVLPIQPTPKKPAHRILISGRRDRRGALQILPPLILADANGKPTETAENILRLALSIA